MPSATSRRRTRAACPTRATAPWPAAKYPLPAVPRLRRASHARLGSRDARAPSTEPSAWPSSARDVRRSGPTGRLACSARRWPVTSSRCSSSATSPSTCPGSWARAMRSTSSACRPDPFPLELGFGPGFAPGRRGGRALRTRPERRAGACATSRRRSPSTRSAQAGPPGARCFGGLSTPARRDAGSADGWTRCHGETRPARPTLPGAHRSGLRRGDAAGSARRPLAAQPSDAALDPSRERSMSRCRA